MRSQLQKHINGHNVLHGSNGNECSTAGTCRDIVTSMQAEWLKNHGSIPSRSYGFLPFPKQPDHLQDPPSHLSMGTMVLSLGVEQPECEADYSALSTVQVKNE